MKTKTDRLHAVVEHAHDDDAEPEVPELFPALLDGEPEDDGEKLTLVLPGETFCKHCFLLIPAWRHGICGDCEEVAA